MIKINDLSYSVENLTIFDSANFEIPSGKLSVIIGTNGVGKTTMLKLISGIIKPKSGNIISDCKELFYLPQKIKYPQGITLAEYIESYFYKNNWKWFLSEKEKTKIDEALSLLELTDKKNVLIDNLSSGELQKANIALGIISNADTILLDEPTANMDLVNRVKVLDFIKKLTSKGISIVVILHDINLCVNYGDWFIGFGKNHKIIAGEKNKFFTQENLKEIFGIDFKVIKDNENIHIQIIG